MNQKSTDMSRVLARGQNACHTSDSLDLISVSEFALCSTLRRFLSRSYARTAKPELAIAPLHQLHTFWFQTSEIREGAFKTSALVSE